MKKGLIREGELIMRPETADGAGGVAREAICDDTGGNWLQNGGCRETLGNGPRASRRADWVLGSGSGGWSRNRFRRAFGNIIVGTEGNRVQMLHSCNIQLKFCERYVPGEAVIAGDNVRIMASWSFIFLSQNSDYIDWTHV
jgi:hypothetical protein